MNSTSLYYNSINFNHSTIEFMSTLFSLLLSIIIIPPALIILLDLDLITIPSYIIYASGLQWARQFNSVFLPIDIGYSSYRDHYVISIQHQLFTGYGHYLLCYYCYIYWLLSYYYYLLPFLTISSILIDLCFTSLIYSFDAMFNSYNWFLTNWNFSSNQNQLHYSVLVLIILLLMVAFIYFSLSISYICFYLYVYYDLYVQHVQEDLDIILLLLIHFYFYLHIVDLYSLHQSY